ncbi:MAG TPA: ISAs1 family transposase [Candidatus Competibacter sp.]|nr:ISAs1 family transposase [Candidatus Competibacter sp.]
MTEWQAHRDRSSDGKQAVRNLEPAILLQLFSTPYPLSWRLWEKDHGRIEIRRYALSSQIDWLEAKPDWAGLQAVGRVESTRMIGDQVGTECRYFLCSSVDQARFAATVRQHWGIENQQHWVLDVQFGEDACRTRRDHSAENLAVIRRMALNVLRHNGPSRDSIRRRKLRAALSDDYRLRLLLGQPSSATA